ncbi:MAG: tyrosine-type recombinase/integrase [Bacteroidaceae bacterium]|nr:tyrosine-type recombinase/integrase [Bacteroidaceae bacterium]MCF0197215.1 tyrosine-type recombinase/integrase [Bacteroidaceae bacterium]
MDEVRRRIALATSERDGFKLSKLKDIRFKHRFVEQRKEEEIQERKRANGEFPKWLRERIMDSSIRDSTKKMHMVVCRLVEQSKIFNHFEDLTSANLKKFDLFLHAKSFPDAQPRKQNTIHGYHKRLKPYVREAYELGLIEKNPYDAIHIKCGKSEGIKYLTIPERDAVEALKLKGTDALVRDLFIFSCYTGLAFADVIKVSKEDVKQAGNSYYIEDFRQKCGSKYRITLLPKAMQILAKYDFNLNRISNQKANMHLKIIAGLAGIQKNLTFHSGRHTFATWALKMGIPIELVSKMLAHADITTTQIYAKVLAEDVDKGFEMLRTRC